MAKLMEGTLIVDGIDRPIAFREQESRNGVLIVEVDRLALTAANLRALADALESRQRTLTTMRKKYADMALTALMFADEDTGPPNQAVDLDDEDEDDEDEDLTALVMENGEVLDSYTTDTGNPMSGGSTTELYEYRGRFWSVCPVHGECDDYDTFEEAYENGGFRYRDEHPEEFEGWEEIDE